MNNDAVTVSGLDQLIFLMDQHGSPHQSVPSTFLMDASSAPLQRRFERLNNALHERLIFSTAKTADSLSTVFGGSRYDLRDQRKVVVESEPNGEKSCTETSDRLTETLSDEYDQYEEDEEYELLDYEEEGEYNESTTKNVAADLVLCGVTGQNVGLRGLMNTQRARFVSIPDGVEKLGESCFSNCKSLSRVTFGESSSLRRIGKDAFRGSGVVEIHIPDGVEELCKSCFCGCKSLSRVKFGESSSLKLIGGGPSG